MTNWLKLAIRLNIWLRRAWQKYLLHKDSILTLEIVFLWSSHICNSYFQAVSWLLIKHHRSEIRSVHPVIAIGFGMPSVSSQSSSLSSSSQVDLIQEEEEEEEEKSAGPSLHIQASPKPFLGGYKDKRNGQEYHHAATQTTLPKKPAPRPVKGTPPQQASAHLAG